MLSLKNYDVVIAGVSFAGLAVASQVKSGRVLLVSPEKAGENCKSAGGTILALTEDWGLKEAVLQVHRKIILHLPQGNLKYFLEKPFCVVDSKKLLLGLFKAGKVEKIEAKVQGLDGEVAKTSRGDFRARIFVDATGPSHQDSHLSFGIETILPYQEEGLHFWYEPQKFSRGIYWLFPQGKVSGFGVGSYQGETVLKKRLEEFVGRFGLKTGDLHGGYFPNRLAQPVVGKVFRVGDSAGQCLPLTGEGIRPAIVFGKRFYYEALYFFQEFLLRLPQKLFYPIAWLASQKPLTDFILRRYLSIIEERR